VRTQSALALACTLPVIGGRFDIERTCPSGARRSVLASVQIRRHTQWVASGAPFNRFDLGQCKRGDVWRVELSAGANVFLVDASNFNAFKSGRNFRYSGGLIERTPHDFVVPNAGHWYIVAHTWGLRNSSRINVYPLVQAHAMPRATPNVVNLSTIAHDAARYAGEEAPPVEPQAKDYDVFISHASDDKDEIVRPLAEELRAAGLEVWYDEFELRIGSSLRRSIDVGLANSRFGVVVLSPAFFGKGYTNYELDGLVTREVASGGRQIILPLWHRVTKDDVMSYSPSLADKLALRTSDHTVAEIAEQIADVIVGDRDGR
jgi:hypothetical protein